VLDFEGRVALVTGAGRGMGRSHARLLASRGARVVVNDLPPAPGEQSAAEAVVREIEAEGGIALANHDSVVGGGEAMVTAAVDRFGQLDVVICNAGVMHTAMFGDCPAEEWHHVSDVHFRGTVEVLRAAWPYLVRSGTGRIITTSSCGMLGNAGSSAYGSAKAATFGLTRSLAWEGMDAGITANCILPAARTRMSDSLNDAAVVEALDRYFQPEHVSALVVWLTHQDTHVTNEAFRVSGGTAGRVMMAALPSVRVAESTPENWAAQKDSLMAPGAMTPIASTADLFGIDLANADPSFRVGTSLSFENLHPDPHG
jgi:NAD(P)-dependent dehydrogenase (short-subunit alcohol dehydrogenase family)